MVRVLAIVSDASEPEAVEFGGRFADEAAALAVVRAAQAQGLIVREPEGVTVIPGAKIVRFLLAPDGGDFPAWSGRRTARRRAVPA